MLKNHDVIQQGMLKCYEWLKIMNIEQVYLSLSEWNTHNSETLDSDELVAMINIAHYMTSKEHSNGKL